jgi:hypothetical protein
MSIVILDTKREGQGVRVTAADYCPQADSPFDGSPFSVIPDWLQQAIVELKVVVYPDSRDYACWKVMTSRGEVIAEPDDFIINRPGGGLEVFTQKSIKGAKC